VSLGDVLGLQNTHMRGKKQSGDGATHRKLIESASLLNVGKSGLQFVELNINLLLSLLRLGHLLNKQQCVSSLSQ